MNSGLGRPIDCMLWKLEKAADARNKKLENFSGYLQLCHILTESDDGEPLDWRTKEWCHKKLRSLIDWVMIGDAISTDEWIRITILEFNDMRRYYANE